MSDVTFRRRPIDPATVLKGDPVTGKTLTAGTAEAAWEAVKNARTMEQQSELAFCRQLAAFYDRGGPKSMGWNTGQGESPVPMMAAQLKLGTRQVYRKINSGRLADFLVTHGSHVSGLQERTLREAIPLMDKPETILEAAMDAQREAQDKADQNAKAVGKTAPRRVDHDPRVFRRHVRMRLPAKDESMGERRLSALMGFKNGLDKIEESLRTLGCQDQSMFSHLQALDGWLKEAGRA